MLMHIKLYIHDELNYIKWFGHLIKLSIYSWWVELHQWFYGHSIGQMLLKLSQAAMWVPFLFFFFSSPDSDDTYAEESEDCSMRDDQYLVSDKLEGKFYGSVHGTGPSGGTSSNPLNIGPSLEQIQRKIHVSFELLSVFFVSTFHATTPSHHFVKACIDSFPIEVAVHEFLNSGVLWKSILMNAN